jgi:hypothetical protein
MRQTRGAESGGNSLAGELGTTLLSLMAGVLLAWLGWTAARQLRATTLERLLLPDTAAAGTWTVALIFRPKECPSRMELVDQLNRMTGPGIGVTGLLVVTPGEFDDWRELVRAQRIRFPVSVTSPEAARSALGTLPTPALVVFDGQRRLRLLTDLANPELTTGLLAQVTALASASSPEKSP